MVKLIESTEGTRLFLIGKSLKGKNRVRENGRIWKIQRLSNSVQFSQKPGPWALVAPEKVTDMDKHGKVSRWVSLWDDQDFQMYVLNEA